MADEKDNKQDERLTGAVKKRNSDFVEKMERPKPWPNPPIDEDNKPSKDKK